MERLTLHTKRATAVLQHAPFVVLYGVGVFEMWRTIGQPYEEALAKAAATQPDDGSDFLPPCMPLPGEYMPTFASRLFVGASVILHILMLLMQHWSVAFHCWLHYRPAPLKEATHALATPPVHQGKPELVAIERTAKGVPYIRFQKQNYMHNPVRLHEHGGFVRVACPDELPLEEYAQHPGLSTPSAKARIMQYGENKFEIEIPSFQDLYVEGLLQPFSVFQFFCVLLWCLDEYWQYSLFTLGMMLMFEGTVVMTRRKNLTSLRGMNNAPRSLLVRRDGAWSRISANKLVPGDVVSVPRGTGGDEDIVPCDCLLLKGTAVVNEATLTGESVPQMKEAVFVDEETAPVKLDVQNRHKVHVLWGGTKMLQHTGAVAEEDRVWSKDSSQDVLDRLRTIAADDVPAGTPDGGCLCYVLRTGFDSSQGRLVRMIQYSSEKVSGNSKEALGATSWLEEGRDQFDLLLHCILIVTSVIPPELYMQMTLAVNTSLMALMKAMIYCTEPFRIPMAGKVDACLFDKTGTITTDELVAAGVVAVSQFPEARAQHKLLSVTGSKPQERHPMGSMPLEASVVIAGCHSLVDVDGKSTGDPLEMTSIKAIKWRFDTNTNTAMPTKDATVTWPASIKPSVKILVRHHFASKLQRMSVVARVSTSTDCGVRGLCVLSKGSPEMIGQLLKDGTMPAWYTPTHRSLAKAGMRVIALAYRRCDDDYDETSVLDAPRTALEKDLLFVGFLAFRCLVRADSKDVVQNLKQSSHAVTMRVSHETGAAPLTAIHVATEVAITRTDKSKLLLLGEKQHQPTADGSSLVWRSADTDAVVSSFDAKTITDLAASYDLCVTGPVRLCAAETSELVWKQASSVRVYARMTPDQKEKLMMALKDTKHHTLMCGDGANDVGALKQAHVGVALLSGFGNANVKRDELTQGDKKSNADAAGARLHVLVTCVHMFRRVRARVCVCVCVCICACVCVHVRECDASIAAPFTSKRPSIESTLDIIRQGRCTLVTTLQMYQILALNCLISSYSLSALYLDGVKSGDRQMTARGLLLTVSFLSISRASPLKKLSSVRPIESIFHPALFLSLLGQFAIHLGCMMYVVSMAKPHLPDNWEPSITGKFEPNLINSVVFLAECVQQVSVFVVNYKGQPFMTSITKNSFLLYSLAFCGAGAFLCASNFFPEFNKLLQLVEYPSEGFRKTLSFVLIGNVVGTIVWDRLMHLIFAPTILFAGFKSITKEDVRKTIKMLLVVGGIMYMIASADPEVWEEYERQMEEYEQGAAAAE
ncbi:hypothetical protein PTSG_07811 [Salpingoeca rosetta]|uniref:Cation-transporting ATPase n=1 Tax=Salpingoeca rosetta (strain ATCC 50818 / BSB-021) TaxID=946362 RepID=F2UGE3_SALR5|nr:uncharacterized protein PTSG_07811 [Salpingoeca rosetta]EGD75693.1 hypothetical protein PTSG_07811 [Salpingoeca rosetta]|eukprot:XP_004991614.1 hypothetical protein PTSG_07811 [Salpingoeca rosetta]